MPRSLLRSTSTLAVLIISLFLFSEQCYCEKQLDNGVKSVSMVWMLTDDSLLATRLDSAEELSNFIKGIDKILYPHLGKIGSTKERQRALFIALRPNKEAKFWFEPSIENLDSKISSSLHKSLLKVTAPTLNFGPIAIGCIIAGSTAEELKPTQPNPPHEWLEVVKKGGGKISMDQLLNHIWDTNPENKNDRRPIVYSSIGSDLPFIKDGQRSIYGKEYQIRDIEGEKATFTAESYKQQLNVRPELICPSGTPAQGNVIMSFVVGENGSPADLRIYHSSNGLFESVAVPLLKGTRLVRATLNGKSISTIKQVEFSFKCVSSCPDGENIIGETPVCVRFGQNGQRS